MRFRWSKYDKVEAGAEQDSEIKAPICEPEWGWVGGGGYYPSVIIMQTDRRQVGRVDKSVSLRDVMS